MEELRHERKIVPVLQLLVEDPYEVLSPAQYVGIDMISGGCDGFKPPS